MTMENNIKVLEKQLESNNLKPKERAFLLNRLGWIHRGRNIKKTLEYTQKGYEYAKEIDYQEGIGLGLLNLAFVDYYAKSDLAAALEKAMQALKIFEKVDYQLGIGQAYTLISVYYWAIDDYDRGFKMMNQAIKMHEKTGFDEGLAWSHYIMGNSYMNLKDLDTAYFHLNIAEKLFDKVGDLGGKNGCISSLGNILQAKGDYELALVQHQKSLELAQNEQFKNFEARALNDLGVTYESLNQYSKALNYLMRSLKIRESTENQQGISTSQTSIGRVLMQTGDYKDALKFLELAEQTCLRIESKNKLMMTHKLRADLYKKMNEPWKALEQYEKFLDVKTKIMGEENSALLKNIQANYNIEKANQDAEIERLKNIELKKAYEQIALQTTKIIDSIKYAKRIQESVLTPVSEIKTHFRDSFVFYKPKDIVSGDFYWFAQQEDHLILAAVDCTGHGVPGAFMVVLANALLNDIVNEKNIIYPAQILKILDEKVREALHQEQNTSSRDGMDLALMVFHRKTSEITFAGAKNPLYRVKNGKIERIKGSKFPIGGSLMKKVTERQYESHTIRVQENEMYYIASDGFADQFGGSMNRKYMAKRFRQFLFQISDLSSEKQLQALENEFEVWKGDTKQTDDILILGVRI